MRRSKGKGEPSATPVEKIKGVPQIDILKAFAIITVVLLHALPLSVFLAIGAPYYFWQAVPVFIVIAGFTGAYMYKKYGATTLRQCYDPGLIIRRFKRLLIPFILCWLAEMGMLYYLAPDHLAGISLPLNFITGGFGWGAYFIPIILQSILFVPLLYLLARRSPNWMVIIALVINIAFDVVVYLFGGGISTESVYLRYIFLGALGVWIVTSKKRNNTWLIIGGGISLIYITVSCYTPLLSAYPEYSGYTGALQAPAAVWTVILVLAGLAYLPTNSPTLIKIGKASWHIFLVQLLYYFAPATFFYDLVVAPLSVGSEILFVLLVIVFNILICVGLGYAWYLSENRIVNYCAG